MRVTRKTIGWAAILAAASVLLLSPIGDFRIDIPMADGPPTPSNFSFVPDPAVFPLTMFVAGVLTLVGLYLLFRKPT
jgi:hypothetical protein